MRSGGRFCARYVNTPISRRGRGRCAGLSGGSSRACTGARRSATVAGGKRCGHE
ncbi:hypothetical protein VB1_CDS0061 [Arthrobacter phage Marchesin]|nr:hypothetical protein VB1_CDS0061 [Arthrobacter phage Marchesin]